MATARVFDSGGGPAGEIELDQGLFGQEPSKYQVYQYVKTYLLNQRQGSSSTKGRSEVRGGGSKPWRQKGTGRARAGTNRSPLWEGGGIVFGPKPKSYYSAVPKRLRRSALISALSDRAAEGKIMIIDPPSLESPSTKTVFEFLGALKLLGKRVLILDENKEAGLPLSCRNIPKLEYKRARLVNAYDIVKAEYVLVTKAGMDSMVEVFTK
jgi:large subunit ribosomal protein L4